MASDMQTSIGHNGDVTRSFVSNRDVADRAERILAAASVARGELALEFETTCRFVGSTPRRGPQLLPADARRHRGCVVVRAHQPVRIPSRAGRGSVRRRAHREGAGGRAGQADRRPAGLRPRARLARVLRAVDGGGVQVCVTRATQPRVPRGPLGAGGEIGWNLGGLGHIDHRKVVVVDGRIGWVGGAGIEDHFENGAFHDLFVRVEGPVVSQLQLVFVDQPALARRRDSGRRASRSCSRRSTEAEPGPGGRAPQRTGPVPADHRRRSPR